MTAYWFKRRRFGWGYTPVTWQGWVTLAVLVVLVVIPSFMLPDEASTASTLLFLLWVFAVAASFVGVCIAKGPRPKWRWGKKDTDDPDEDF